MKRITSTVAISAALALSACKGGSAGSATKYIPDAAEFIGGVQLSKVVNEGGFKAEMDKALAADDSAKEGFEAMKACNIDPYGMEQLVFGGTTKEDFAFVLVGAGVGKAENITCISGKIKEKEGGDKEPITVDGTKLVMGDGDGSGWIVDDKTVVIASSGWASTVEGLIGGKGTSAVDGGLKDAMALTDSGKHVWAAGKIPAEAAGQLGPAAGLTMAGMAMDLSGGGLGLAVKGKFADADKAKATADEANKQFEQVKPMAGMLGVPQGMVDSIKIEASGDTLSVTAKASKEDLEAVKKKLEEQGAMPGM